MMAMMDNNVKPREDGRSMVPYSDEGLFKKPLLRPAGGGKQHKLTVRDEESYIHNLENIIERDFFPDLPKLRVQTEYVEARENNDVVKLRQLHHQYAARLAGSSRPGTAESNNSPWTFETPLRQASASSRTPMDLDGGDDGDKASTADDDDVDKPAEPASLDAYLATTTSEDNASFGVIMEEAKKQHQLKYAWLYKDENASAERRERQLALPPIEAQAIQDERPAQVDSWVYKNRNSLMYVPDGVDFTDAEADAAKRKQREIVPVHTRYQKAPFNEQANRQAILETAQIQARQKEGKIGIDGKELLPADTPTVNGYGFVKTPSPMPGVDDSPFMTWGEIEGTPFCLDGKNTPLAHTTGPQFRIPEVPARDKLAIVLADNIRQRHRVKKQAALRAVQENWVSPHRQRSSTSEQLGTMSPAAQRLASSRLGIRTGLDKALIASYSPRSVSLTSPSSTPQPIFPCELKLPCTPSSAKRSEIDSLTDGLLQIPKRPRAKDFFASQEN